MEFHVGDYVENADASAYWSDEQRLKEWIRDNCPRFAETWTHTYPKVGVRGTIVYIGSYTPSWSTRKRMVMYFLSDDRNGYLVDEDNFPNGVIETTDAEEDD